MGLSCVVIRLDWSSDGVLLQFETFAMYFTSGYFFTNIILTLETCPSSLSGLSMTYVT